METIAKVLPDQEVDPLIAHTDYVGQALQRVDGDAKVRGEARFTAEFKLDNLAYAALVHSTIAKGRIRKIDTEAAGQAPGVLAVITYQNMPRIKAPPIVDFHNIDKGFALSDLPIMQDAEIHWDGEPVAMVVAETLERAEHAASLVSVEYDAETPEVSFEGAKSKAVVPKDIMGEPPEIKIGDAEKAFAEADKRVGLMYRTPRYNHNAIEPHATTALWNEDGSLAGFRCHAIRQPDRAHAGVCIRPQDGRCPRGRAICWRWFRRQNRLEQYAALRGGRESSRIVPVKLALTREDTFRMVGGRTISEQYVGLGAQNDGKLTALIHTGLTATTLSGRYAEQCTFPPRHLYASPNLYIGQKMVYLDTVANTWMRAPGESIGTFALESAIDELAYELRMDPIEVRRIRSSPRRIRPETPHFPVVI